jgi:hypothetical protein
MPARKPAASPAGPAASRERRVALIVKLQIAAAVFGPMLLLAIWLQSKGFFGAPGA